VILLLVEGRVGILTTFVGSDSGRCAVRECPSRELGEDCASAKPPDLTVSTLTIIAAFCEGHKVGRRC
jgi:hypothetical protein